MFKLFATEFLTLLLNATAARREAYKEQTGEDGISLPDPIAMSIAIDPTIGIEWSQHHVDIETTSELTRGMTVVDRLGVASDERNRPIWDATLQNQNKMNVCWTIDDQRWKQLLFESLQRD